MYDELKYATSPTAAETAALLREIAAGLLGPDMALHILAATAPATARRANAHAMAVACAAGHAEALARRMGWTPAKATVIAREPETTPPVAGAAVERPTASSSVPSTEPDDFTLIRGLDAAAAELLRAFRLTHFRDLAAFTPEDAAIIGDALADPRRLSKECWIEQAALLARGRDTAFARRERMRRREAAVVATFPAKARYAHAAVDRPAAPMIGTVVDLHLADTIVVISPLVTADPVPPMPEPARPAGTSNVIPITAAKRKAMPARRRHSAAMWAAIATSVIVVAAASSFAITPAFAQYLESLRCTDSLIGFTSACEKLSWFNG